MTIFKLKGAQSLSETSRDVDHYAWFCFHTCVNLLRDRAPERMSPALLVAFSALLSISIADLSSEYAHHAVLDPAELLKLYWTVDWDKETISFAVEAATTGWVGFGFSSGNGMMVGSDVVIGWVKDSKGYLTVG